MYRFNGTISFHFFGINAQELVGYMAVSCLVFAMVFPSSFMLGVGSPSVSLWELIEPLSDMA